MQHCCFTFCKLDNGYIPSVHVKVFTILPGLSMVCMLQVVQPRHDCQQSLWQVADRRSSCQRWQTTECRKCTLYTKIGLAFSCWQHLAQPCHVPR